MGARPSYARMRRNRRVREQERFDGLPDEITDISTPKRFLRKDLKGRLIDVRNPSSREWPSYFEMGGEATPWQPPG